MFAHVFKGAGLTLIEEPILGFLPGYSLSNERIRRLCVALTGDKIDDAPFWSGYVDLVRLRNEIVHRGKRVPTDDAQRAFATAGQLIHHLELLVIKGEWRKRSRPGHSAV